MANIRQQGPKPTPDIIQEQHKPKPKPPKKPPPKPPEKPKK
jgi:hypothetical protein